MLHRYVIPCVSKAINNRLTNRLNWYFRYLHTVNSVIIHLYTPTHIFYNKGQLERRWHSHLSPSLLHSYGGILP